MTLQLSPPDFIVLTNMFCLQNNFNLIIHQKAERPLSFSMSLVRDPDVRDRVLVLTYMQSRCPLLYIIESKFCRMGGDMGTGTDT